VVLAGVIYDGKQRCCRAAADQPCVKKCGKERQGGITMKKLTTLATALLWAACAKAPAFAPMSMRADPYTGFSCNSLAAGHEALDSSRRQSGTRPAFS
jgi:hypothetical protein